MFFMGQSGRDAVTRQKQQMQMLTVSMVFLAVFVGISDMLGGYDRYIYSELFDDVADLISADRSPFQANIFEQYPKEIGYDLYNVIVAYLTANRYIFILLTTFIIYILLFQSLKQYCDNYPFAVILFLALWFFFSFTYLRQVMGATIAWLSINYIIDRKMWKFLLVWLIAFLFHNSAVIFLPLYFIPIRKFEPKTIMWVMAILLALGLTGGPSALFAAYGEVDARRAEIGGNETGFRIAYIVEAAFFLYIILTKYRDIPDTPRHTVLLNMALVFCGILLFFIKNENGGRLAWYYMIGVISTVTYLCTHTARNKDLALFMLVVCFFLFSRFVIQWTYLISPYKTFFTDGTRKYDPIEEQYEYDHSYDKDKFYRAPFRFIKSAELDL